MTATRTSTASAERVATRPRVGRARDHAGALRRHAPGHHRAPGRVRRGARRGARRRARRPGRLARAQPRGHRGRLRGFENDGLDGVLVVMLTYGPGMRVARALTETRLPICLANIQPVPARSPTAWDMADLTYNQGIHGAQDTANAMVRAGRAFHVVTGDWRSEAFQTAVDRVGARGRRGHALADAEDRRLRLRDERHGRHPRRRARAAARRSARRSTRSRRARSSAPPRRCPTRTSAS